MTSPLIDAPTTPGAAVLVLEDGRTFTGRAYGATGTTLGEVVFNTGMTGYQETLTDPSYYQQIVVMTAPHIGNTGVNDEDPESVRIWVAGFVVRDAARTPSNWRSQRALDEELATQNIVSISGIDTRALTRHLRERGTMRAGIFSGDALTHDGFPRRITSMVEQVRQAPTMKGANLAHLVSTQQAYTVEPAGQFAGHTPLATVVAVDLGIKSMTSQRLSERGIKVHVIPANSTIADIESYNPDGVFFSNGPGDPEASTHEVDLLREVLDRKIPYFGICFGNQILGRALGFGTYKLPYGHRGINQPVKDLITGKVEITSQNHGFAVDAPIGEETIAPHANGRYGKVVVSHIGLNDNVVEGLECRDIPAFSVQYHPEAAAGPHDAAYLFDRFVTLLTSGATTATGLSRAERVATKES
ncbi:glutamine-hydrolyzing carbamoyl-phosphate synthase small subunit [Jonesia denitrificans]|uniref:Carbamoyl phosphate synthase small chain n=1 Tax=Jonesia denitrificans (strain ATCC 14870 / DSM 20603 / BCRC 15368 / CIP 55.134 / JCM 11481 / NBRC 15587 / NCTC 10816 / Prevot 55134) TaxID=471856 RepID=C7R4C1_JONDD|nr:glutamine-hydrolyzing carbamoyl-phosphate synthase small subunit [Jonesia denitrificans]ACV08978.1 carbamoyl-phosphate synthase, small subunit [Jonesia denitrificans DSM 20603]ASE09722.1 carbamoyl-phosphate synthase small subunit [Jonesia denitrificans]QXB44259.1 glutamine-hydrolyzing carbamoyl-phosphate synthase small subunit [Jonesia denitrificans]SQH21066.1 Carbamoyl-phosphate synthase small chain [Jonesia denitrificans]